MNKKNESLSKSIRYTVMFLFALTVIILYTTFNNNRNIPKENIDYKCKDCNVIWIVVDALRSDHTGYGGYGRDVTPNLDWLAERSIVYSSAFAQSSWTKASVASFLTSQYPHTFIPPTEHYINWVLPSSSLTLAEVLSDDGYSTACIAENGFLNPRFQLDQGFDSFEHTMGDARKLTDEFMKKDKKQPFFMYLHYIDPHHPYDPPPEYQLWIDKEYEDVKNLSVNLTWISVWWNRELYEKGLLDERDIQFLVDCYDGEVFFVDSELGRLFQHLTEEGLWNNTIVVVTADHGEEFFEHGSGEHGQSLYNELLHVPLIIWNPRLNAGVVDNQVSLMDVAPTILDVLDIPTPSSFSGSSLVGVRANATIYGESTIYIQRRKSIQINNWKLIYNLMEDGYINETFNVHINASFELYDIAGDPNETVNVVQHHPDVVALLKRTLFKWTTTSFTYTNETASLDEELIAQLKSLGYI